MNILGLNFLHPNASAAIFVDGVLVAAAEEERYNRVKYSAGIPLQAIAFCLRQANLRFKEVDVITYARSTNARIVDRDQVHFQDRIYRVDSLYDRYRISLKLINFKETLADYFQVPVETLVFKLQEQKHHRSHMLSGFYCSPFEKALLVSCDAFGDFVSLRTGVGTGTDVEELDSAEFPHSIGLFYTMVTQFLGFVNYGEESKVMGLSTFGYPEFTDRLRGIISRKNGEIRLNLEYLLQEGGVGTSWSEHTPDIGQLYSHNLEQLLGPRRDPREELTGRHQNIAASLQHLTEELIFSIIEDLHSRYQIPDLVLTGGLAYNSLLNSRILAETPIERVYVPPAPGNSGLCIGSVLASMGEAAPRTEMTHAFWGSEYSSEEVPRLLGERGGLGEETDDPAAAAVELLESGKSVGWFQGRMEFGPRSLGNRCILMNPSSLDPHRIKQRDYLKPFGISILENSAGEYFLDSHPSPFMSFMGKIRGKHRHQFEKVLLNSLCRYQTVGGENPRFQDLLSRFRQRTGLPFLINTSLNPRGQPIVESPAHLFDNMSGMHLDAAVVGDTIVANRVAARE